MSYMFCDGKREAESLLKTAVERIPAILEEFGHYFPNDGRVGITVWKEFKGFVWCVPAALTFDNEVVRNYPAFDLLEMDLLNMEMAVIAKSR